VGPNPAIIRGAAALPCGACGLAWEACTKDVHNAAPWVAIKGRDVVPHRCSIQGRIRHPRHEDGRGIAFPLDVTYTTVSASEGDLESEFKAPSPGTYSQPIHGHRLPCLPIRSARVSDSLGIRPGADHLSVG